VFKSVKIKGKVERITPKTELIYLQDILETNFTLKIKVSAEIISQIKVGDKLRCKKSAFGSKKDADDFNKIKSEIVNLYEKMEEILNG
jgi:hypothetical protein